MLGILVVALGLVLGVGCGGGSSSPAAVGNVVAITLEFVALNDGSGPDPEIFEAAILLDGSEVHREDLTDSRGGCTGCGMGVVVNGVQNGRHTVALQVLDQSDFVVELVVDGRVNAGVRAQIDLPTTTASVSVGDTVSFSFEL